MRETLRQFARRRRRELIAANNDGRLVRELVHDFYPDKSFHEEYLAAARLAATGGPLPQHVLDEMERIQPGSSTDVSQHEEPADEPDL